MSHSAPSGGKHDSSLDLLATGSLFDAESGLHKVPIVCLDIARGSAVGSTRLPNFMTSLKWVSAILRERSDNK